MGPSMTNPQSDPDSLVLRGGTVLTMDKAHTVLEGADVLVVGDSIAAIGVGLEVPAGTVEIDAGGGAILPGLIDTHVHITGEGLNLASLLTTPFSYRFYETIGYMRKTLDVGITTIRDAGGADAGG